MPRRSSSSGSLPRVLARLAGAMALVAWCVSADAQAQVRLDESTLHGSVASVRTEEFGADGAVVSAVEESYDEHGIIVYRRRATMAGGIVDESAFEVIAPPSHARRTAGIVVRERSVAGRGDGEREHRLALAAKGRVVVRDVYDASGRLIASMRYRYSADGRLAASATRAMSADDLTVETFAYAEDGSLRERDVRTAGGLIREVYVETLDTQGNWIDRRVTRYGPSGVEHGHLRRTIVYARTGA